MKKSTKGKSTGMSMIAGIIFFLSAYFTLGLISADSGIINAAPGQIVTDEITLGNAGQSEISIQAPASFFGWTLNPSQGPSTRQGTLLVEATGSWQIMVSANTVTGGHMAEYDPSTSQYISEGKKLKTSLKITAENGNEVDLSKGGLLVQGLGDRTIPITFEQTATKDDKHLPNGHDYRISLTFTASPAY
jgi:hypothetical protein